MSTLAVIGLGYVGLPLVVGAAESGLTVVGVDANAAIVDRLNSGRSHVDDIDDNVVRRLIQEHGFRATVDSSVLSEAEVIVVCVPTPLSLDGGPDLSAVRSAAADIGRHLTAGTLVVLESTTYPGTTEEVFLPLLETGGLRAGQDFNLAFSPERIDPGNSTWGLRNTPKVVGGLTASCAERAAQFYGRFVDEVVVARGTREAEMAKLLENTYRHVNIALINEMARFSHELGIDIWDVIRCASTKPFGFQPFFPGPGVGGHCIPIDPNYLSHAVRSKLHYPFRFVDLAQEINETMPTYVVRRIQDLLNGTGRSVRGARLLLLGVTYKADIADQRESPARDLAERLLLLGAHLSYHDPFVPTWDINGSTTLRAADDLDAAVKETDLLVVIQAHSCYELSRLSELAPLVFDTRGRLSGDNVERL